MKKVSALHFDDQAAAHATNVEFFVGSVVYEHVYSKARGVKSDISCMPVSKDRLRMIRIKEIGSLNFSVNACVLNMGVSLNGMQISRNWTAATHAR
jgi:hypothetical protein